MQSLTARTLDDITREIHAFSNNILVNAVEIGRRLFEAKAMVKHGEWGGYLESIGYKPSTANNFMRLFEAYGDDQMTLFGAGLKNEAYRGLGMSQAVELLALTDGEREQFVIEHKAEDMTVVQIREELKKAKAEKEAALQSLSQESAAQADALKREIQEAEKRAAGLQDELTRVKNALDSAENKQADAKQLKEIKKEKARLETERDIAMKEAASSKAALKRQESELEAAKKALASAKSPVSKADEDLAKFKVMFDRWQDDFYELMSAANANERRESLCKAICGAIVRMQESLANQLGEIEQETA